MSTDKPQNATSATPTPPRLPLYTDGGTAPLLPAGQRFRYELEPGSIATGIASRKAGPFEQTEHVCRFDVHRNIKTGQVSADDTGEPVRAGWQVLGNCTLQF